MNVLDHGHCRLINHMGDDLSIVRAARVSYDADWRTGEDEGKDTKLIHYLMRNRHTSPFEAVTFTFDVKAPIFVFRQWHRHRTWSFNEVSARYSELPEEFYVPETVGVQATHNKQMRMMEDNASEAEIRQLIQVQCQESFNTYRRLLEAGTPRELARGVLPMNTYSHMFATVDLHNLFHFLKLRLHEHAQYEIQVYARAILEQIRSVVPVAVSAFEETL
ncbi:faD-dependent thymidylate synthase [Caudoviricetes sp.]|nr:faD-dependent thymidylate synthase [Caudoviricetes sp.]